MKLFLAPIQGMTIACYRKLSVPFHITSIYINNILKTILQSFAISKLRHGWRTNQDMSEIGPVFPTPLGLKTQPGAYVLLANLSLRQVGSCM